MKKARKKEVEKTQIQQKAGQLLFITSLKEYALIFFPKSDNINDVSLSKVYCCQIYMSFKVVPKGPKKL